MLKGARQYKPGASIGGVLVQEMVSGGTETIVGLSYDSQLGATRNPRVGLTLFGEVLPDLLAQLVSAEELRASRRDDVGESR